MYNLIQRDREKERESKRREGERKETYFQRNQTEWKTSLILLHKAP